jgi:hypothetical protein
MTGAKVNFIKCHPTLFVVPVWAGFTINPKNSFGRPIKIKYFEPASISFFSRLENIKINKLRPPKSGNVRIKHDTVCETELMPSQNKIKQIKNTIKEQ